MSDNAESATGITVEYSTDGGNTYTEIGEIRDTEIQERTADIAETNDHKTTSKTYIGGLVDEGEFDTELNLIPDDTAHKAMRSNVASKLDWRVTLPAAITADNQATFKGVLQKFGPVSLPMSGPMRAPLTVKISGAVTWATA